MYRYTFQRKARFKKSFIPYATYHWNDLTLSDRSLSLPLFKKKITKSVRPVSASYFSIGPRYTCALLTRFRLGTYNLNFNLYSRNLVTSPACSCGDPCESIHHYFLYCPNYSEHRNSLFSNLEKLVGFVTNLSDLSENALVHLLIKGSTFLSDSHNTKLLLLVQTFLKETKRFE